MTLPQNTSSIMNMFLISEFNRKNDLYSALKTNSQISELKLF